MSTSTFFVVNNDESPKEKSRTESNNCQFKPEVFTPNKTIQQSLTPHLPLLTPITTLDFLEDRKRLGPCTDSPYCSNSRQDRFFAESCNRSLGTSMIRSDRRYFCRLNHGKGIITPFPSGHTALLEKKKKLYQKSQHVPFWGVRKIVINPIDSDDLNRFPDNSVTNHTFKWYNCTMASLWNTFSRFDTLFILVISLIEVTFMDSSLLALSMSTSLCLSLLLCLFRDGIEDYARFIMIYSMSENHYCAVIDGHKPQFKNVSWKTLKVGNIIRLQNEEEVPADIVLLATSNPDGILFVKTENITGNATLQKKVAIKETRGEITSQAISSLRGRVACEKPTTLLDSFSGSLRLDAYPRSSPLDINCFIMQGSTLCHADWIYGLIVYTGPDTRIAKTCLSSCKKKFFLDQTGFNRLLLLTLFVQCFTVIVAIICSMKIVPQVTSYTRFGGTRIPFSEVLLEAFIFFAPAIPYPISVTLHLVHFIQSLSFGWSLYMLETDHEGQSIASSILSPAANSLLGQVNFAIMDKTGTLTQNEMVFKACSIKGKLYSRPYSLFEKPSPHNKDMPSQCQNKMTLLMDPSKQISAMNRRHSWSGWNFHQNIGSNKCLIQNSKTHTTRSNPYEQYIYQRQDQSFFEHESVLRTELLPENEPHSLYNTRTIDPNMFCLPCRVELAKYLQYYQLIEYYKTYHNTTDEFLFHTTHPPFKPHTCLKKNYFLENHLNQSFKLKQCDSYQRLSRSFEDEADSVDYSQSCLMFSAISEQPNESFLQNRYEHDLDYIRNERSFNASKKKFPLLGQSVTMTPQFKSRNQMAHSTVSLSYPIKNNLKPSPCPFNHSDNIRHNKMNARKGPSHTSRALLPFHFLELSSTLKKKVAFTDERIFQDLHKRNKRSRLIHEFLRAMCVCNSVVPSIDISSMLHQVRPSELYKETEKSNNCSHSSCCPSLPLIYINKKSRDLQTCTDYNKSNCRSFQYLSDQSTPTQFTPYALNDEEHQGFPIDINKQSIHLPSNNSHNRSFNDTEGTLDCNTLNVEYKQEDNMLSSLRWTRTHSWDTSLISAIKCRAEYPEEECLVAGAMTMGYSLILRTCNSLTMQVGRRLIRYDILGLNKFTASRQRMSILIRKEGATQGCLYCKGADVSVLPLCNNSKRNSRETFLRTERHIRLFARQGLRTLVIARRTLTLEECEEFQRLRRATDMTLQSKSEYLQRIVERFENNLELLGVTGVEEKVADGAIDIVRSLNSAGIRIWMVTGDSVDLALRMAYSVKLLQTSSRIFRLDLHTKEQKPRNQMMTLHNQFKKEMQDRDCHIPLALLVTGKDLEVFFSSSDLKTLFFTMACSSDLLLCGRMTPEYKALLIHEMKALIIPCPVILAVGDGANDAPMLQEAHCGVAIRQNYVVSSLIPFSDVVIPSLKHLKPLLFIHGRLFTLRNNAIALWVVFKSFCTLFCLFIYGGATSWSFTTLFPPELFYFQDLLFTILCGIYAGSMTDVISTRVAIYLPTVYLLSRRHNHSSLRLWCIHGIEAILTSGTMMGTIMLDLKHVGLTNSGKLNYSQMEFGLVSLIYNTTIFAIKILCISRHWSLSAPIVTIIAAGIGCINFMCVCPIVFPDSLLVQAKRIARLPEFWFRLLFFCLFTFLADFFINKVAHVFCPDITDEIRHVCVFTKKQASELFKIHNQRQNTDDNQHCIGSKLKRIKQCSPRTKQHLKIAKLYDEIVDYFNPMQHQHIIEALPKPQHFRLLCKTSLQDRYYIPLPFVSTVDRLWCSIDYHHKKANHTARQQLSETVLRLYNNVWGKPSSFHRTYTKMNQTLKLSSYLFHRSHSGYSDQTYLLNNKRRKSVSSYLRKPSSIDDDDEEKSSVFSDTEKVPIIKISKLIKLATLTFRDQQLEADYKAHQKHEIRRYKRSYRFILFVLCLLGLALVAYNLFFVREKDQVSYFCIIISFLPSVPAIILFFLSLSEFLFTEKFNLVVGLFIIIAALLRFVTDSVEAHDGVTTASIFSVTVFVVLHIPFRHAVAYNAFFTILFIVRYLLSILSFTKTTLKGITHIFHSFETKSLSYDSHVFDTHVCIFQLIRYLPLLLGIQAFTGFVGYSLEYNQRKRFLLNYRVEMSRRKQREILNTMLPSFVVDQMLNCTETKHGIPVGLIAEDRGTVSVIFCDVYDFQNIVASVEPTHLVKVLDSLFLCFDKCAEQFNCTKIETVFESYLAAAGVRLSQETDREDCEQQHAFDALDMALAMLEISKYITYDIISNHRPHGEHLDHRHNRLHPLKDSRPPSLIQLSSYCDKMEECSVPIKLKDKHTTQVTSTYPISMTNVSPHTGSFDSVDRSIEPTTHRIQVKIGIHSGRVISGVVGAKKPQYALFGDTVNTASRMKTAGDSDSIRISEATYHLIKSDELVTWDKQTIDIKGKGLMNTYSLKHVIESDDGVSPIRISSPMNQLYHHDMSLDRIGIDPNDSSHWSPMDVVRTVRFESRRRNRTRTSSQHCTETCDIPYSLNDHQLLFPQDVFHHVPDETPLSFLMTSAKNSEYPSSHYPHPSTLLSSFSHNPQSSYNPRDHTALRTIPSTDTFMMNEEHLQLFNYLDTKQQAFGRHHPSSLMAMNIYESDETLTNRRIQKTIKSDISPSESSNNFQSSTYPQHTRVDDYPTLSSKQWRTLMALDNEGLKTHFHHKRQHSHERFGYGTHDRPTCELSTTELPVCWLLLRFKNCQKEHAYKKHYYQDHSTMNTIENALLIFLVAFFFQSFVSVLLPRRSETDTWPLNGFISWGIRTTISSIAFILWLLLHYREHPIISNVIGVRTLIFLLNFNFLAASCKVMIIDYWRGYVLNQKTAPWLNTDTLELFFYITLLHYNSGLLFQHLILINGFLIATTIAFLILVSPPSLIAKEALLIIPVFIFANMFTAYFKEYVDRLTYRLNEDMQHTEDRARELLYDMLPKQVLKEFQQDKLKLAYKHEKMSFLFADICGFTSWTEKVEARQVVEMLQQLFARFDEDSTSLGLFKLCTIGDAYVAVSEPVTEETTNHNPARGAEHIITMARRMEKNIHAVRHALNIPNLNMRIGLHYGQCVGGVIGSGRLRYDLWGLDVLTGNMMESGGKPGHICISEPLKLFLNQHFPQQFQFEYHTTIKVIRNYVKSYILNDRAEKPIQIE